MLCFSVQLSQDKLVLNLNLFWQNLRNKLHLIFIFFGRNLLIRVKLGYTPNFTFLGLLEVA